MAICTTFSDWMLFERLDKNEGLASSYTLAYKITDDNTGEVWTSRLARFKNRDEVAIEGATTLLRTAVPQLMRALQIDVRRTVFLPALSSSETAADVNRAVPRIVSTLARDIGCGADMISLSKKPHRPIHGIFVSADRSAELDKAEYSCTPLRAERVFVFDDLITQGGTLSRIAQAIHSTTSNVAVYGIALGKTERRAWKQDVSNDHVSKGWNDLWVIGERSYQERTKA